MYMVPPFLAYYGVLSSNQTLVSEAYNQISLYRSYLLDRRTNHLWHHIVLGTLSSGAPNDLGHWATGRFVCDISRCISIYLPQATHGLPLECFVFSVQSKTPNMPSR